MEGSATTLAFQPVLSEEQIHWQMKLDFQQLQKKKTQTNKNEINQPKQKKRMSNIFTRFWIISAVGLTDHNKIRTGSSPFLQKLPSTLGRKSVGGGNQEKAGVA